MTEIEKLQSEISALKSQIEEKKHALIECKYSRRPIFSQRLRKARLKAELTQDQLADGLGMAMMTVSQYETSKREPNVSTLIKIADYLDISLDWLCGRTEKMELE